MPRVTRPQRAVANGDSDDDALSAPVRMSVRANVPRPVGQIFHADFLPIEADPVSDHEAAASEDTEASSDEDAGEAPDDEVVQHLVVPSTESVVDDALRECGLIEIGHDIFLLGDDGQPGRNLGRIEYLWGSTFSTKGRCMCGHEPANEQEPQCILMLIKVASFNEKLRKVCEWMRDGATCSRAEHLASALATRQHYGYRK